MLWFFGLAVTCSLAVAAVCFAMAAAPEFWTSQRDDYGASGMVGAGLLICSAIFSVGAITGFIALRTDRQLEACKRDAAFYRSSAEQWHDAAEKWRADFLEAEGK